jgi:hypothetical protein
MIDLRSSAPNDYICSLLFFTRTTALHSHFTLGSMNSINSTLRSTRTFLWDFSLVFFSYKLFYCIGCTSCLQTASMYERERQRSCTLLTHHKFHFINPFKQLFNCTVDTLNVECVVCEQERKQSFN